MPSAALADNVEGNPPSHIRTYTRLLNTLRVIRGSSFGNTVPILSQIWGAG